MNEKYTLKKECGTSLKRIVALRDFCDVRKGDTGGLIESEANLSHDGDAWVFGNARVSGNAKVSKRSDILNVIGVRYPITIVPQYVICGCRKFTHEEFRNLTLKGCKDPNWTEEELEGYKLSLQIWESMQRTRR